MKLTLTAVLALTSLLVSTTAAFDAQRDCCVPPSDTFDHVASSRKRDCDVTVNLEDVDISCGHTSLGLVPSANLIRIILPGTEPNDQSLTVHGACMRNGKQVAHMDLHVATPANQRFQHDFNAFNRQCDGDAFVFTYYSMTAKEFEACKKQPVKPIN